LKPSPPKADAAGGPTGFGRLASLEFIRAGGFCLLLAAVTFAAYLPAIRGDYIWDDDAWTTVILWVLRDSSGLLTMWTLPTALQQYYPLTGTTFWIDYQLWGLSPLPQHIENVFLHVVGAVLFWRLLRRLAVRGAWMAALLFALHPVMVESAGWITERKNVLSLVFYLGGLLAYGQFTGFWGEPVSSSPRGRRAGAWWAVAFVCYLAATLAKSTAFSFPAVLLLLCWWKRGRIRVRADVVPSLPFFAGAVGFGLFTLWIETHHLGASGVGFTLSFPERCLIAGRAFWFYIGKLAWPAGLSFLYPRWQMNPAAWWQWFYPASAAAVLVVPWLLRGRLGRGPATALFFYVGTLFPVLGFMNAYGMRYAYVWDHWVYLSSLGLIALFAALLVRAADALHSPAAAPVCGLCIAAWLGVLTWRQGFQYANLETLWRVTLEKNPEAFLAHNQVGLARLDKGQVDEAVAHFRKALDIWPDFAEAHNNLGNVWFRQGRLPEALTEYETAVRLDPKLASAHNNLGAALLERGRVSESIAHLRRALELRRDFSATHNLLGTALMRTGETNAAIEEFRAATQLNPDFALACFNLGSALYPAGGASEAMVCFHRALSLDPSLAIPASDFAGGLRLHGDAAGAIALYGWAIDAAPDHPFLLNNLAWVLAAAPEAAARNGIRAVELGEKAAQLTQQTNPLVLGTLAAAYAEAGRFSNAVLTVNRAISLANARTNATHAAVLEKQRTAYEAGRPVREE
jgi:tetratricopeptide (TPR) repeat protein